MDGNSLSPLDHISLHCPPLDHMALFLLIFFTVLSSAFACDRCLHQSKAAFFRHDSSLSPGACGYGPLALSFNGGYLAAAVPSLYKNGSGCGAMFQVKCKDTSICSRQGTTVILTDHNPSNNTDLVLSNRAFAAMANKGMGKELLYRGIMDVEYKRIPCEYGKRNLSLRVEEFSHEPNYLAIKVLYQGGQTEMVGIDVAQVGLSNWCSLRRNYGVVWDTSRAPTGPLQFRFIVTSGYDGSVVWAKNVLPAEWKPGVTYDTGVQVTSIAQEGCSPCDDEPWK